MEFDVGSLVTSFAVSGVGFVLFSYGRKRQRGPHMGSGLVLMIFPYFVSNVVGMLAITGVLLAGLWLAVRGGY